MGTRRQKSPQNASARAWRRLDWGVVRITAGRHKGKLGYYDDDGDRYAIVYLGTRFFTPYIHVRHTSLRKATAAEVARWSRSNESELPVARALKRWRDP